MTSKPKVVVFIDWYLPAYKAGGPVRSVANLLDHLANEIDFHIITGDRDYMDEHPFADVPRDKWTNVNKAQVMYLSPEKRTVAHYKSLVTSIDPQHIYLNGIFSNEFSIKPLMALSKTDYQVTIASRGMLKPSALAIKGLKKKVFLRYAKIKGLYKTCRFHATDEQEAADIKKAIGRNTLVYVASNMPRDISGYSFDSKAKSTGQLELVFAGRIAAEKNLKYALDLLTTMPVAGLSLKIYGAIYDQAYWQECKALIDKLNGQMSISYNGVLEPDEMMTALSKAHLLFLPTAGENFGHIILESMMMSRPVLISDNTPWRNLEDEQVGFDQSLSRPEDFKAVIKQFVDMSQSEYDSWSKAAFDKAKTYCTDKRRHQLNKGLFLSDA